MSTQEVCRLCLSEDNLMCVFDKRLEKTDHMKEVILITTGVEIHSKDVISQKICTKCGRDAIKMFQFRQQSLKNDRYLKAQCRELLKHTDLKIPNTDVTIKTERIDKEDIQQEPPRKPPYKVHPTMTELSRKYPQMQFPAVCLLYNVSPCVSMEMDTVENYFRKRNLNMRKYVQVAQRASNDVITKKTSTITKSLVKFTENSANNRTTDYGAQSTSRSIPKTAEVVDKINPINIKLNQSGYAIVRPSTESIVHCEVETVRGSTTLIKKLITSCLESQSGIISESRKRRFSDNDNLSEPDSKKVPSANPFNITPIQPSVGKIATPVFKCNICSSVVFSAIHLKNHQIGHSRCSFCKTQFKSVGMMQQHINDSCLVKEALSDMPDVEVERVELNMNVRLQHRDAFVNFPPLPGLEKTTPASESTETAEEYIDVEIISDDEDTSVRTEKSVSTNPVCSNNSAHTRPTVTKTLHENPSVSLVIRPDVRMKNDKVLDSLKRQTPDIEIVKELLTKFEKLQSTTEATQTELPRTESIRMKKGIFAAELINLKQALHSYQIPVKILKGPVNAWYNYQSTPQRPKILKLWNDLTLIDVGTKNTPVSELVIVDITESHSNSITNDANSINTSNSCDSFNNHQTSLPNIEMLLPDSSNSSASSQRKSPTTSSQTQSLTSTPESFTVVQAESHNSLHTQSSFNTNIQNNRKLLDSPHSNPNSLVQATSPIADIPILRYSPNSNSLGIYPAQATSSIPNTPGGRYYSGVEHTTSVPNQSDVNASWNSYISQSEALDCSTTKRQDLTKTRQDLTDVVIDYVFSKSSDTCAKNVRPPNGVVYSNNKKQPRPRISKTSVPKRKTIQRDQNTRYVPATTNSRANGQSTYNPPIQNNTLNDDNLFKKPPPPYPNGSTLVNQTTQSYISSHANTSHVPQQKSGYLNAFHQYVCQLQEFRSFQTPDTSAGVHYPKDLTNTVAHHDQTGHFEAPYPLRNALENRSMNRIPEHFGYHGSESSTFHYYSKASEYVNASVAVDTVNQNYNVSSRQLPNATCTDSSTLAAGDSLTNSVPPSDKTIHFASGMIRVRSVSELT